MGKEIGKGYWYKGILVGLIVVLGLFVASCGKDPVFMQGDYIYENEDFTLVDNVNGIIIHWADNMDISEEQKSVIQQLVANMVKVDGGFFLMGAQHTDVQGDGYDSEAQDNESPVHEVRLNDYYIGKYEITQREWSVIMGYDLTWSDLYGQGSQMPAYGVSWEKANAFVEQLNAMTNLSFRLPTEAQWEYAARGGCLSQHYRYSGSNAVDEVAWHITNSGNMLHNVGLKFPNELGLYDMSGSLWEWCLDSYGPYTEAVSLNPLVTSGSPYVLRGGSWNYLPSYCRVTCRDAFEGNAVSISVGFRVVMGG